jgi:hypothetical protein
MNGPINPGGRGSALQRVGWLILIWVCSVATLGLAALAIRMLMKLAGMTR